ncbi:YybH family protein [Lentzea sp. NPDC058436]|uniref:YybH family protein n=1 Tax=Lentzea sp. NPDC058436 TaxID=3346499 RepID=UPI003648BD0B
MTVAETELESQIRQRMLDWREVFKSKDVDGVMSFYADGDAFTAFDLMPPIEFSGGEMWRENWVAFFAAFDGPFEFEFSGMRVHASGELGFARLLARLAGTMNGQEVDFWVRTTNCFRLIGGEWLMVHDHVSMPTDFATGQTMTHLSPDKPFG